MSKELIGFMLESGDQAVHLAKSINPDLDEIDAQIIFAKGIISHGVLVWKENVLYRFGVPAGIVRQSTQGSDWVYVMIPHIGAGSFDTIEQAKKALVAKLREMTEVFYSEMEIGDGFDILG